MDHKICCLVSPKVYYVVFRIFIDFKQLYVPYNVCKIFDEIIHYLHINRILKMFAHEYKLVAGL